MSRAVWVLFSSINLWPITENRVGAEQTTKVVTTARMILVFMVHFGRRLAGNLTGAAVSAETESRIAADLGFQRALQTGLLDRGKSMIDLLEMALQLVHRVVQDS